MLELVDSARPVFNPATPKLTFAIPPESGREVARKGDVLLAVLLHDPADTFTLPAGWIDLGSDGASAVTARYIGRMVDDREPTELVVSLLAASAEWQGQLFVIRGSGALALLKEASSSATFAATMTPASSTADSLQAINLALCIFSAASALTLTPPAGFDLVDSYDTALVGARSAMFAIKVANQTGTITPGDGAASANATGRAFLLVMRDTLPVTPGELYDSVPGNIGLLGRDLRPPREVPFGA